MHWDKRYHIAWVLLVRVGGGRGHKEIGLILCGREDPHISAP